VDALDSIPVDFSIVLLKEAHPAVQRSDNKAIPMWGWLCCYSTFPDCFNAASEDPNWRFSALKK
jgi:hypothetical protein